MQVMLMSPVGPHRGANDNLFSNDAKARRTIVFATVALWTANWALLTARSYLDDSPYFGEIAVLRIGLCLAGCLICYFLHLALRHLGERKFLHKVLAAALLAPLAADGYAWLNQFVADLFLGPSKPLSPGQILLSLSLYIWLFFAWSTLYLALVYSYRSAAQERRWAELKELTHAAQLQALRYQVNPHFLFNTLNSISALILDNKVREADAMVRRLSEFFRGSLAIGGDEVIELRDELSLQRAYLAIEQVRFPDLRVAVRVSEQASAALVPSLILQPLVENAVKFGAAASSEPTRIEIVGETIENSLTLRVLDDGRAKGHSPGTGVGLANVRQRIQAMYGSRGFVKAGPSQPHGFEVELRLPYEAAR